MSPLSTRTHATPSVFAPIVRAGLSPADSQRRFIRRSPALILLAGLICSAGGSAHGQSETERPGPNPVKVGTFSAEVRSIFTTRDGLPHDKIHSVAVTREGQAYAGTANGLALFDQNSSRWNPIEGIDGPVKLLARHEGVVLATVGRSLVSLADARVQVLAPLPEAAHRPESLRSLAGGKTILLGTTSGLFQLAGGAFVPVDELGGLLKDEREIRQVAASDDGRVAVASPVGLFLRNAEGTWQELAPRAGNQSWALDDVRGAGFDARGRLWFCSRQGAGSLDGPEWSLYTGRDGLPYDDFTTFAPGEDGVVWFGTKIGAIRKSDTGWNYRQGLRWLPDDLVHDIAVDGDGNAWFATDKGVGRIERRPITLAEKARVFEEEIDRYHRRTPYGFVLGVNLPKPGDRSEWVNHDSDNDGLWTGMYGAGECFAYAATRDPKAKQRATAAFEALAFLSEVTQGGSHPAPPGFPARTILPTSGPNPNLQDNYSAERDFVKKIADPLWKVIVPRWPTSADGKWYWKTDTSSDELDGHYFLYALYYDLVAETDEEKARAREVVARVTDHLIEHDFNLVDHDGKPTRWGVFGPKELNGLFWTAQRGLNSLSVLSYLKVAEHVTGDEKYAKAYHRLVHDHGYAGNALHAKVHAGRATGNQSDDEMAFMCFYNILKYEQAPALRSVYLSSLWRYWALEEPEMCPLFNFIFAASFQGIGPLRGAPQSCLDDAADTLKRLPLDRIRWGFKNSHRSDVIPLAPYPFFRRRGDRGHLPNGKVIPIDERYVEHWNHDPWRLDEGGSGGEMGDGAVFLLPYYMGLYHKFLVE